LSGIAFFTLTLCFEILIKSRNAWQTKWFGSKVLIHSYRAIDTRFITNRVLVQANVVRNACGCIVGLIDKCAATNGALCAILCTWITKLTQCAFKAIPLHFMLLFVFVVGDKVPTRAKEASGEFIVGLMLVLTGRANFTLCCGLNKVPASDAVLALVCVVVLVGGSCLVE